MMRTRTVNNKVISLDVIAWPFCNLQASEQGSVECKHRWSSWKAVFYCRFVF